MPDYKQMYFDLAGKVADAADLLVSALQAAENQYLEGQEAPLVLTKEERDKPADK